MHEIKNAAIVLPKKAGTSKSRLFIHRSGNSILHSISSHFHPRCQIKYRPTPSFLRFSFSFQEDLSPKTRRYISKKAVHLMLSVQGVGLFIASSRRHPRCQIKCRQTIPIISAVYDYFQNISRNPSCQQVIRMLLFVNCLFSELAKTNLIGKLQNT